MLEDYDSNEETQEYIHKDLITPNLNPDAKTDYDNTQIDYV